MYAQCMVKILFYIHSPWFVCLLELYFCIVKDRSVIITTYFNANINNIFSKKFQFK